MRRLFGLVLVGSLLLAVASTASAQVSVTFGNPSRGTGVTFGGYGVAPGTPGSAYGNPYYGSPRSYAPYVTTAPSYGYNTGYGYTGTYSNSGYGSAYPSAPNSGYNSAYSGYTYPGTTSSSFRSDPGGYGPTYSNPSYGYNPYGSGYGYGSGHGYPTYGYIRIR